MHKIMKIYVNNYYPFWEPRTRINTIDKFHYLLLSKHIGSTNKP